MRKNPFRPTWPERIPTFDYQNRLIAEDYVAEGRIIANIKFDAETGSKRSYTTGLVTHFYNNDGRLIRKEIRDQNNDVMLTESYSPIDGELHSMGDIPSKEIRSTYGNVIYAAWHCYGKRHRYGVRDPQSKNITPRPALMKLNELEGTREEQFYKDDVLEDPQPKHPALRVIKDGRVVKSAHYFNNQLHNDNGPALRAEDEDGFIEALACQGKLVSAIIESPNGKTNLEFDANGKLKKETTDVQCQDSDAAALLKQVMKTAPAAPQTPVQINRGFLNAKSRQADGDTNATV